MLSKGEQTMSYGFLHSRSDGSHRRIGPQRLGKPLLVAIALLAGAVAGHVLCAAPVDVPVIKGDLGPCSADFTVLDSTNKPVYDAKVHVTIRYGFMNQRKSDLEIGTNSEGKARIEGLPDRLKKPPLEFRIKGGDSEKSVTQDPATDCHASFNVQLGKP
jgi:hypothetical protein